MQLADLELARRLERTEGEASASFVESRRRLMPETGASYTKIEGAYCMCDGMDSPITQTFGLGMFEPLTPAGLDAIEQFFAERGARAFHEVSPLADGSAVTLLNERQYQPFEFTSVMFVPVADVVVEQVDATGVRVRKIERQDAELWAQTMADGWSDVADIPGLLELSRVVASREESPAFLAEIDGRAVATAAMFVHEGVALMAGACTVAASRKQGAQRALIAARYQYALDLGCDLLMMCAQPGSGSQRNAERQGFRIAYTRIKWQPRPGAVS